MHTETVSTSVGACDKQQRLPYTSPVLKVFGQLRELTDGGSGVLNEGGMMTAPTRMI